MTTARSVAARTARTIRCIVIGYVAVQVAIWHSFYAADPWRLAGPAIAVAWAAVVVAYLRRSWPGWQLACLDTAIHVAFAIGLVWSVPAVMRGDTSNWLFILMAGQVVVPAWFAPTRLLVPLAVASGVAYWAGAVMLPGPAPGSNPVAAGYLLATVAAVAWCAAWSLYRWATAADAALALADRDSREHYVVLSRDIERREHERLLHDTVLNTLTALARAGGGGAAGVVGRCRHDVTLMEYVLSIPAEAGDRGEAGDASVAGQASVASQPEPDEAARRSYGGMVAAIEAVASEMRDRGLTVHVTTVGSVAGASAAGTTTGAGRMAGADGPAGPVRVPAVPVPVAVAMANAVREALANVASHAGTGEAWVEIRPVTPDGTGTAPAEDGSPAVSGTTPAGSGPAAGSDPATGHEAAPKGVRVTVRDTGAGFDPGNVDPARLGLRRSIVERLADWGGLALIRSSPGAGTEIILCWPSSPGTSQAVVPGGGGAMAGVLW
jgi:hypothetical protein